jgi:DNA-binding beta-propeller fold protein YncE
VDSISEVREPRRTVSVCVVAAVIAMAALLSIAANAGAAELVYWDNYRPEPGTVSFANIDGSGGGPVNLTGITLEGPEGMAFDSATGRLYVASSSGGATKKGEIVFANVDGSGAGVLATPGAEVNEPYGVAIDPATRTIYWTNAGGGPEGKGSIAFARLDGSGGALLNTTGVTVNGPYRLAIDPVSGRVYWDNAGTEPDTLAFANLNNSGGGGTLPLPAVPEGMYGIAVDSAAGRVYWLDSTSGKERLLFANVNGSGGGEVNLTGAVDKDGYGLAVDPAIGRIYWGNYGFGGSVPEAIGFVNLAGGGGAITPATAPVNGAQDPVILKSPAGTGVPKVTRSKGSRSVLNCSQGSWAADLAGGFVYQTPRTYAYQWNRNGKAVSGATGSTLKTKSAGKYTCTVTGANQAGSASQTSAAVNVKAAKLKLTVKKAGKAQAGGVAKFTVKAVNQGDLKSKSARICVKVPKSARKAIKAPKCKKLSKLGGHGKGSAKLKVKLSASAAGTYRITFVVKGVAGKPAKVKLQVS